MTSETYDPVLLLILVWGQQRDGFLMYHIVLMYSILLEHGVYMDEQRYELGTQSKVP